MASLLLAAALLSLLVLAHSAAAADEPTFAQLVESLAKNGTALDPAKSFALLDLDPECEAAINKQVK